MKIQLSDFSYVDRAKRRKGKALRFTLSLQVPLIDGQRFEFTMEGCLAFYDYLKVLRWAPPMMRFSAQMTKQCHWINSVGYDIVLDLLHENPKLLENLITPMQKLLEMERENRKVQATDPTLPKLIEGGNL